jgi:hypothetical protein
MGEVLWEVPPLCVRRNPSSAKIGEHGVYHGGFGLQLRNLHGVKLLRPWRLTHYFPT